MSAAGPAMCQTAVRSSWRCRTRSNMIAHDSEVCSLERRHLPAAAVWPRPACGRQAAAVCALRVQRAEHFAPVCLTLNRLTVNWALAVRALYKVPGTRGAIHGHFSCSFALKMEKKLGGRGPFESSVNTVYLLHELKHPIDGFFHIFFNFPRTPSPCS